MKSNDLEIERTVLALLERILAMPEDERRYWLQCNLPDDPLVENRIKGLLQLAAAIGDETQLRRFGLPPEIGKFLNG